MTSFVCEDCRFFFHNADTVYSYDLKNVCGRCYAIYAGHPSTRKVK